LSGSIVLGIESAIAGGSICLTRSGAEIGSWVGDQNVSKAEELLPNIDRLLRENSLNPKDIDRIVVSIGPGSFTGIKVGISTVLGLRAALGTTCLGISALQAMSLTNCKVAVTAAVPVGRGTICVQSFTESKPASEPALLNEREVDALSESGSALILHGSLYDTERFPNAVDAGWNIAAHLCAAVDSEFASNDLQPLFVERKSANI
jgi:tRNA threonylcarbamoyladenosine biosynthesis protein TsaB